MEKPGLINLFKKGFYDIYNNPLVIIPGILIFILLTLFSLISVKINYNLSNSITLAIWLVIFSLISLFIISYFSSGLIGISGEIARNKKPGFLELLKNSNKFWLKNFIIIVLIIISYNIIWLISQNGASLIGKSLSLEVNLAKLVFFFIYFLGLLGVIIFLTFSPFYLIIKNKSILESLRNSAILVKKNYLKTILILALFFALNGILGFTPERVEEIINLFILPYFALIFARFVVSFDAK